MRADASPPPWTADEQNAFLKCIFGKDDLTTTTPPDGGYIKILPGYDHGSIFGSPEMRNQSSEMLAYLRRTGHAPPATQQLRAGNRHDQPDDREERAHFRNAIRLECDRQHVAGDRPEGDVIVVPEIRQSQPHLIGRAVIGSLNLRAELAERVRAVNVEQII